MNDKSSPARNNDDDSKTALNPNQTRVVTNLPPGASRLHYTTDNRPLLPEYQGGDLKFVVETLDALLQLAWGKGDDL